MAKSSKIVKAKKSPVSVKKPGLTVGEMRTMPACFRPPCWRWLTVMEWLADPTRPLDDLKDDRPLYVGAVMYRRNKFGDGRDKVTLSQDELSAYRNAFHIYTHCYGRYGWRWMIEALLMTAEDELEISQLSGSLNARTIAAYRDLFFDVDGLLPYPLDTVTNVLNAARSASSGSEVYDYTWKNFAYRWGMQDFLGYVQTGRLSDDHKDWFKEQTGVRLLEGAAQASADTRSLFCEATLAILATARDHWLLPKEDNDINVRVSNQLLVQMLDESTKQVHVQLMGATERYPAIEAIPSYALPVALLPPPSVETVAQTAV